MQRIRSTTRRLGGVFILTAFVLLSVLGGYILGSDNLNAPRECNFVGEGAEAVDADLTSLGTLDVDDMVTVRFGSAGGVETGLAEFETALGKDLGGILTAQPNLLTDRTSGRRISPEDQMVEATLDNSRIVVRLCIDSEDIEPGHYTGAITVADAVDIDAEVRYNDWTMVLGLPLAVAVAVVATAAVDDKVHTRYLFLVGLGGAIVAWLTFRENAALTTAPQFLEMLGAQFVGASGGLVALKTLIPADRDDPVLQPSGQLPPLMP